MGDMNTIGVSVKRKEDYRFLTGAGTYLDYCMPRADDVPSYKVGTKVTACTLTRWG